MAIELRPIWSCYLDDLRIGRDDDANAKPEISRFQTEIRRLKVVISY